MTYDIQLIDPTTFAVWDELLSTHPKSSFFHSSSWARVLAETYGYTPVYFAILRNRELSALMPCMEVKSAITGNRGVSLPFTDYCEPLFEDALQLKALFDKMNEQGQRSGWKYVEMRPENALPEFYQPSCNHLGHILDLVEDERAMFSRLRDSTRRNIKKAKGAGVQIEIGCTHAVLREFIRLNCMTRRDHGLPPQPDAFFEKIHQHVLVPEQGMIVLARFEGTIVAGAMYFHFGKKAVYKYGASDKQYQHIRANNLLMWEAIRWYASKGCRQLCFGRTEPENKGLQQFKAGWGAREAVIHYYKYDLGRGAFIQDSLKVSGMHNGIIRRMPIPMLKIAGSLLYRHMG